MLQADIGCAHLYIQDPIKDKDFFNYFLSAIFWPKHKFMSKNLQDFLWDT